MKTLRDPYEPSGGLTLNPTNPAVRPPAGLPVSLPTNPPTGPPTDDEIDLGELVFSLWRGKVWVVTMVALAALIGVLYIASTFPTYQADAWVQLEDRTGRMGLPTEMQDLVQTAGSATTETDIIRSRRILGQVVAQQNLDWHVSPATAPVIGTILQRYDIPVPDLDLLEPYARKGEGVTLEFLQVPPAWVGEDLQVTITASGFAVATPDGTVLQGRAGEMVGLEAQDFAIRLVDITAPVNREYTIRQVSLRQASDALRSRLSISETGRQSNILQIQLTGGDRDMTERVLESIATTYVRQNIERSAAEAESGLAFIRTQLPTAEEHLRRAQEALNQFREETSDRALAQERLDGLEVSAFESRALLGRISRAEAELRSVKQRIEENRSQYPEEHLIFRQLYAEMDEIETELSELLLRVQDLPETQREAINLTREVELAQQVYFDLQSRAQEMQVLSASTVGSVRVLDAASAKGSPVAPRVHLVLALAMTLGAMIGISIVLIRNWMYRGIQSASELDALGLPVFASINYTPKADVKFRRKARRPVIAVDAPNDPAVEAFRSLRTGLYFGMLDATSKAILITSSAPAVGKSFTSVNLAAVAAQAGQRVVLVDADMRRGNLRSHFGIAKDAPGLTQYLAGIAKLDTVIHGTDVDNLFVVPSGLYPPNPSELLMRNELHKFIKTLNKLVDLIIIDAPPVLAVTDPVILAKAVGTSVLVARFDMTLGAEIEAVQKNFQNAGVHLSGSILNGFDPRKVRRPYGYSYPQYTYSQHSGKW